MLEPSLPSPNQTQEPGVEVGQQIARALQQARLYVSELESQ